ncbi:MAG: hypothetical protein GY786_02125 [Proteobacteria bacterium]|nr:hypothetical protein [Pseudomonadota bacterium]
MGRTIIIGDVHGCYLEFQNLLNKVGFNKGKDHLYLTGDIINRGPRSREVFLLSQEIGAQVVLGNHEFFLLKHASAEVTNYGWIEDLKVEFGTLYPKLIRSIKTWPHFIETEEFLLVHGGLSPIHPPEKTDPQTLVSIRTWDGCGDDLRSKKNPPWYDFYKGSKLVVFGHWGALEGIVKKNVIGLDTGCVYGKKLSALILPGREIVSVPAQEVYCPI